MARRTIRTGIGTYLRADGVWFYGLLGDEVEVADSDLERFDRLNVGAAPEAAPEVEPEPVEDVARPAHAAKRTHSGRGRG